MTTQTQTPSEALQDLAARYETTKTWNEYAASRSCSMSALRSIGGFNGHPRWAETIEREDLPRNPSDEDVEDSRAERAVARAAHRAVSQALYRALLEAGTAYEVVDHSDRLNSRPFEIRPANLPYVERSFVSGHGSSLRLARYGSREAAERGVEKVIAAEIARLDSEATR